MSTTFRNWIETFNGNEFNFTVEADTRLEAMKIAQDRFPTATVVETYEGIILYGLEDKTAEFGKNSISPLKQIRGFCKDEIVCPWCGYIISDSWDYPDTAEIDCGECDKGFTAYRHVSVYYETFKKDIV